MHVASSRGLVPTALAIWILIAASFAYGATEQRWTTTFPFEWSQEGLMYVSVKVVAGVSGNFLLDTGCDVSIISDALAKRTGLKPYAFSDKGGQRGRFVDGTVPDAVTFRFKLGSFDFDTDGWPFFVIQSTRLTSMDEGMDGTVGLDRFVNVAVLFDFQQKMVTLLYPGNLSLEALTRISMQDALVVQRSPSPLFGFGVPLSLNSDSPVDLVIDTGRCNTALSAGTARRLRLKASKLSDLTTFFGKYPICSGKVGSARMGSVNLGSLAISWSAKEDPPGGLDCLGLDVLRRFRVLMDYQANKLYLQPATFPLGPDVDVRWDNNGDLRVTRVSKGRAPDIAGLRVGDVIEGVGTGMPTPGSLWSIADCAAKPVGVDVDLCVRHAGGQTAERIVFHAAPAATPARR